MEIFTLVEKKRSTLFNLGTICAIVWAVISVLAMLFVSPILMPVAVILCVVAYVLKRRFVEFEYSYFDGEIRFAKIINKSKRKAISRYSMDDVIMIAPAGDRSVYSYEQNSEIKVRDLSTGNDGVQVYVMVAKGDKGQELIKFEPDERILDAMCIKYRMKVKR